MLRLKTVYSFPVCFECRASVFSCANFWNFITFPLTVIIALFLTFATQGMWKKTNTYLERPILNFRENIFILFEDNEGQIQQFWSPITAWNERWSAYLGFPAFETNTLDIDNDDRPEEIRINIHFRSLQNNLTTFNQFQVITFALFFDVRLERRALLQLQMCPVIGRINRPFNYHNSLSIIGILELTQREPLLPSWGNLTLSPFEWAEKALEAVKMKNNSDNNTLIDTTKFDENYVELKTKMNSVFWALQNFQIDQNITVELVKSAHDWNIHSDLSNETDPINFFINYRLKINEQIFVYKTDIWEMLKWTWVQFLAIYIIIRTLFNSLSAFMYKNQILETVIVRPHSLDDWTCKLK